MFWAMDIRTLSTRCELLGILEESQMNAYMLRLFVVRYVSHQDGQDLHY
jgi:hypothetical protein